MQLLCKRTDPYLQRTGRTVAMGFGDLADLIYTSGSGPDDRGAIKSLIWRRARFNLEVATYPDVNSRLGGAYATASRAGIMHSIPICR